MQPKEVSGKTKEEKGLDLPVFELDPNTRRGFTKVKGDRYNAMAVVASSAVVNRRQMGSVVLRVNSTHYVYIQI